jgi:hypothetical protein
MLVQESAYKTPVGSPVLGTSMIYPRLSDSNAFTMRAKPNQVRVPRGGGQATNAYVVSAKTDLEGTLKIVLCYSQAAFLLGWATTPINAGQTLPYVTTEPPGDLASMAIYHAILRSDSTLKRRVYLGSKVVSWTLENSADSPLLMLTLNIRASTPQGNIHDSSTDPNSTVFPAPADTAFPTDAVLFTHLAGGVTLSGSARTQFDSLRLSATHATDPKTFESVYVNVHRFWGRETTLAMTNYYKPTPDDRSTYEAVTVGSNTIVWTGASHTITATMNAQNVFTTVDDDLGIDKCFMQSAEMLNNWDASAGGDISFAVT